MVFLVVFITLNRFWSGIFSELRRGWGEAENPPPSVFEAQEKQGLNRVKTDGAEEGIISKTKQFNNTEFPLEICFTSVWWP